MAVIGDILQPTHLLFVLVIALLVLGPKRLPEVGRSLGRGLRDFRMAMSGDDREEEPVLPPPPPPPPAAETVTRPAEPAMSGDDRAEEPLFPQPSPVVDPVTRPAEPAEHIS